MSRPVAGQEYTIVKGDTLWDIATLVYGSGFKYTIIWDANKQHLRSNDPHWIYPGEKLWIPEDPDALDEAESESGETPVTPGTFGKAGAEPFSLTIEGVKIPVSEGSLTVSYNSPADGFAVTVDYLGAPWEIYEQIADFQTFKKAKLSLYGLDMGSFLVYDTSVSFTSSSGRAVLSGYSRTVDLMDCSPDSGITEHSIKFSDWIRKLIKPLGIGLDYKADSDPVIKKAKIDKTDTLYSSIEELADKYGVFVSSDQKGRLVVQDLPDNTDPPVGNFNDENFTPLSQGGMSFSGRDFFSTITVYGNVKRKHIQYSKAADFVSHRRHKAVTASTITDSELQEAWDKTFYDSMNKAFSFTITVDGWYNDIATLWAPGQFVTIQGLRFLIGAPIKLYVKTVKYNISSVGQTAELTIAPLRTETGSTVEALLTNNIEEL